MTDWVPIIVVVVIFGGALLGFFTTKTSGFGKYTASLLLLILVLFVGSIAFITGKIEVSLLANLLFAIAGYAGGLVTPKSSNEPVKTTSA